jgi:ABC-type branched-subunit amino acid transport system substrate-binding protein
MLVRKVTVAAIAAALLLTAACGSDDGKAKAANGSKEPAANADAGGFKLDSPVKVSLLWEVKGESALAIDDYQQGAQIGIDEVNAAGGIGGQQIVATRVSLSGTDTQKATGQFLQAVDADPVAIIGFPASGALLAAESNIERAGVPVLAPVSGADVVAFGSPGVSELTWIVNIRSAQSATTAVDYFVDELGLKKIGLLGTNESYGTVSVAGSKAELKKKGLEPVAERLYPPTATDLTPQVQAMKGADAVLHWGYPNTTGLQLKQFQSNGIDIPTGAGGSGVNAVTQGLASGAAVAKLYAFTACNPSATGNTPELTKFTADFKTKYGRVPSAQAVQARDSLYILKAAIEKAKTTEPKALNTAIGAVTVKGACSSKYKADAAHFMEHEMAIVKYAADGTGTIEKMAALPEVPKF